MSVTVEQLPGEQIFVATFSQPFDPTQDTKDMFKVFVPMRSGIKGPWALVLDFTATSADVGAFSQMIIGMAEASAHIRLSKNEEGMSPPFVFYVGTGEILALAADSMAQTQYGGVKGRTAASRDEAITLARTTLSDVLKST